MHRALLLLLILSSAPFTGCNGIQKKHDNPVMVSAPRRVDPEETPDSGDTYDPKEDESGNLQQVVNTLTKNPWEDWKDDTTIFNSQVAATVNGAPILNGDVLDRYAGYLISVRGEMQKAASNPKMKGQIPSPDDYEKFRHALIQREIMPYIQKKLLVERLKSGMKPDQLKMMESHVDEQFEKEYERLKRDLKVSNKTELEIELNKKGTTIKNVRDNFALDRLAGECVAIKSEKPKPINRPDLLAYYQSHPDDFMVNSKVKWEQIQVTTDMIDKKAARKKLDLAIAELKSGVPFETVARKYSDGPTAKDGGVWDWMEEGNLSDVKLEKKLFSMPVDQLSDIHESAEALSVVRVTERQMAGRKPFIEVQNEIHSIMEKEQNANRSKKLFKELFSNAVVETQYSIPHLAPEE